MSEKILKCDDLNYLEDLEVFSKYVLGKIRLDNYTVKESYSKISKEKEDGEKYIKINEDKCYDNKITSFIIKVNPNDNSIISYKADGPAIFNYVKPYTKSTPYISNREAMSIGYKVSTGDIMNTTKVFDHLIMDKVNNYPLYMTKEFFKGDEKDEDHPHLHTIINTRFIFDNEEESLYSHAVEELTTIDNDGNILDFTKANVIYASTVQGENIKINHKYKYTSSENDKDNIYPKLDILDENSIKVTYIRMRDPYNILGEEHFSITDNKTLSPTYINNQFAEIFIDDNTRCTAKTRIDDTLYNVESDCNFPLSGDIFMFSEYKGNATFAMSSYFNNIYDTQVGGLVFLTNNSIYRISAIDNSLENKEKYSIDYEYDNYEIINSQLYKFGDTEEELCKYNNTEKLPSGNTIIESCIFAEPTFPINKKSIFYRAVEIDRHTDEIVSDYRALIVNQKDYS